MPQRQPFAITTGPVRVALEQGVATLSFHRPEAMNALDVPAATAFLEACRGVAAEPGVRAVVVRGEGRAFGAGGDLAALEAGGARTAVALIERMHESVRILAELDAPVIASLHGVVAGGSLSLALACDLAIAAEGTRFNLAYANVAASCDVGASWSLPRIVGLRKAMEIALLSPTFDAAEAQRLGLVNQVVAADELTARTRALALRIAGGPTLAYGRMKRLLRRSCGTDLATQLDAEREAFGASAGTRDFQEALAAFFARRDAVFTGH